MRFTASSSDLHVLHSPTGARGRTSTAGHMLASTIGVEFTQ